MRVRKSAVEQRRAEIDRQFMRLRSQLAQKSREHFTTDFRHRAWLEHTNGLMASLLEELSALSDPGEYDELPAAVVADELGLGLDQIRRLIRLGEMEAAGPPARARVPRAELERLARLTPETHLALAAQNVEHIFADAVERLRAGDIATARRGYVRIRARETCIGDHAIALEIAIGLAEGRYDDASRVVRFVTVERFRHRDAIRSYLALAMRGASFKSKEARREALRLFKLLGEGQAGVAEEGVVEDDTEQTALYVAAAAQEAVRWLITMHLPPARHDEFRQRLRGAVFTALYAWAHAGNSLRSTAYLAELGRLIPHFWEPLQLSEDLREE